MSLGGIQLLKELKDKLNPKFVVWYIKEFISKRMCYLHWSAGHRNTNFEDYHILVAEDHGIVSVHHNCDASTDMHAHTFQRNRDSFAMCIASMYGGTTQNLGLEAPTKGQIETLVREMVAVLTKLRVPVGNIMTHAEAADNVDGAQELDFYGPEHGCERWDFHVNICPTTLKIMSAFSIKPNGWLYFPDWLRGSVISQIQEATRQHWDH